MSRSALPLLACLGLVAVVVAGVVPGAASPQPSPLCGPCGGSFETGAQEYLDDATVTHSTATVLVHENGTATWHVENRFQNASTAEYFREHPGFLDTVVEDTLGDGTVEGQFTVQSVAVDGRTVELTYRDADAVQTRVGDAVVVDYLHTHGRELLPRMNVDRLTIVGPSGTVVTNDPAGATVDGRRATWQGDGSGRYYEAPEAPSSTYVVFAEPGPMTGLTTPVAVALATLPTVLGSLLAHHLPATVVFSIMFALSVWSAGVVGRRFDPDRRNVAGWIAVLGAVGVVAGTVFGDLAPNERLFAAVGWVGLLVGGVAVARDDETRLRDLLLAGGVALAVVALVPVVTETNSYVTAGDALGRGLATAAGLLPLVLATAVGAVPAGARRARVVAGFLAVVGFFAATIVHISPLQSYWGLVTILLVVWGLVAAVLCAPFVLLGSVVADAGNPTVPAAEPAADD